MEHWTRHLRETARVDVLAAAAARREMKRGVRLTGYAALSFVGALASWAARGWLGGGADQRIIGWGPFLTIVGLVLLGFGLKSLWKAHIIRQAAEDGGDRNA